MIEVSDEQHHSSVCCGMLVRANKMSLLVVKIGILPAGVITSSVSFCLVVLVIS